MKFDFTTEYDRRGMDALAVDGLALIPGKSPDRPKKGFDVIPMWIADMSFPTVPTVISAMQRRLEHPIFGYFMPSKEYYESIIQWHARHHQVTGLTRKHIGHENDQKASVGQMSGAAENLLYPAIGVGVCVIGVIVFFLKKRRV